ncbi:MAG: T9SS type B sorting domain-containing protein, partial [Bacteroidetes bacterium]|nr:T9SS type B sorting domain-containing protein [Bacteroidota bacterium]
SPGYEILWIGPNNFSSNEFEIDSLGAGTYTFAVTDTNGCSASGAFTFDPVQPITIDAEITDAACETESGIINITVSNGTASYQYNWSNGSTDQDIINVESGIYFVDITDANGCMATDTFEVDTENILEVEATISDLNCFGDSTGMIMLSLQEGQEPVDYSWSGPNEYNNTGEMISGLEAGEYSLNAMDANGCTLQETYTVNQPAELVIEELMADIYSNGFNLSGFQSGDGTIFEPEVDGGTSPYSFAWTADNGYASQEMSNLLNLDAGIYTLIVTDANLCMDTAAIELTEPIPLEIPNGISPNFDGFNDNFIVRGLSEFPQNKLTVLNRWGNIVYEEENYRNSDPWSGTNNGGDELPEGTYFVIVELNGEDNLKGYLELRR